jgi:hypothetical protein
VSIEAIREKLAVKPRVCVGRDCLECNGEGCLMFACEGPGSAFTTDEMREVLTRLDRVESSLAALLIAMDESERNRSTSDNP